MRNITPNLLTLSKNINVRFVLIIFLIPFCYACITTNSNLKDPWEYPICLGDTRAEIHKLMSNPSRSNEFLEEYPLSGITVWFDSKGCVSKINFHGEAGNIYTEPESMISANWIPTDKSFFNGLTAFSNKNEFEQILGHPIRGNKATTPAPANNTSYKSGREALDAWRANRQRNELRQVWKKDGFIIDALFYESAESDKGKDVLNGSLIWCEISKGI